MSTVSKTHWTGDKFDARPLHTQDNTTQKGKDRHSCLKRDSNPRSHVQATKAYASDRAATRTGIVLSRLLLTNTVILLTRLFIFSTENGYASRWIYTQVWSPKSVRSTLCMCIC
jgi:hypothetical protein